MDSRRFELKIPAETDRLPQLLDFLEQHLEEADCSPKALMQLSVAAEEVFVNIAHYAYAPGTGEAALCLELRQEPPAAVLTFRDSGVPFDPLARPDPDVTLSAEDRDIGGLGIYMTKKIMDDVCYEYREGQNVLRLEKSLV